MLVSDRARTQIQAIWLQIPCSVFKLLLLFIIVYVWYAIHIRNNIWYRINAQLRNVHYHYHCYEIVSKSIPFTGYIIFCCIIIYFTVLLLLGFFKKLRYNWYITLYFFLVFSVMIWYLYILQNDHHNKHS